MSDANADPWNRLLSRPLALKGGGTLETLRDAANHLMAVARGVVRDPILTAAMSLLMQAATTGEAADVEIATKQVERYLASVRAI